MNLIIIILLGIIQGACEFLPVSSSGHLVVFYNFFGITANTILLSIILHVATLVAVCIVYHKDLWLLMKKPFCKTNLLLVAATVPTIVVVLLLKRFITQSFSGDFVIWCFLFTALLLFVSEVVSKKRCNNQNNSISCTTNTNLLPETNVYNYNISYGQALVIGFVQGIAALPGISRSGSTIAAGLLVGVNKNQVANFSFLLSVPIILASLVFELLQLKTQSAVFDFTFLQLFIGFVVACVVGYLCLKTMVRLVKKQKLTLFSVYLVLLCAFLLLNKYAFFWF